MNLGKNMRNIFGHAIFAAAVKYWLHFCLPYFPVV